MTKARFIGCSIILGFASSLSALAETAYTAKTASLRAGPSRDYPIVTRIPPETPVEVVGCLDDWAWCDVIAGPDRGWMYSGNLEYAYGGRRVIVLHEGPGIGLPIVTFSVGPYWDSYYRGRPWYGRRHYWIGRPLPPRHAWVRPSGPRAFRSPGARPPGARHIESRPPAAVHPSGPRPPRPAPDRARVQPPRRVERRAAPVQAHPPNRPQPARPARPQEKKHGPGAS